MGRRRGLGVVVLVLAAALGGAAVAVAAGPFTVWIVTSGAEEDVTALHSKTHTGALGTRAPRDLLVARQGSLRDAVLAREEALRRERRALVLRRAEARRPLQAAAPRVAATDRAVAGGERVERTEDVAPALERGLAADVTPRQTLSEIRAPALASGTQFQPTGAGRPNGNRRRQIEASAYDLCRAPQRAIEEPVKRVAVLQSCYIPWKGYFDLVNSVDEFVLYDDCQYTRQDWRNRNRIKTAQGSRWLTIPVRVDGLYSQRLDHTDVADPEWSTRHWDVLRQAYRRAPHFERYSESLRAAYEDVSTEPRLSRINRRLLEAVCAMLHIPTRITWSTDYILSGDPNDRNDRLISLLRSAGADRYLSGPRARAYIDERGFAEAGISLDYFDYDGYPAYPQGSPPFEHSVTVLDLLFNTGPDAPRFMKSFRLDRGLVLDER